MGSCRSEGPDPKPWQITSPMAVAISKCRPVAFYSNFQLFVSIGRECRKRLCFELCKQVEIQFSVPFILVTRQDRRCCLYTGWQYAGQVDPPSLLSFCEARTKETVQCSEDIRLCGKLVSWHWLYILCPLLVSFFFQLPIALVPATPGPRDALSFSFWFILVLRPSWFSTGLLGFPGSLTLYLFVFPASFFSYSSWHCLVLPIFSYGVPLSCWDCMELLILVSLDIFAFAFPIVLLALLHPSAILPSSGGCLETFLACSI